MNCPSCGQTASSFLRYVFSLQGVTIRKSMHGHFRCQHCGALLRVASFDKLFWALFAGAVVALAVFVLVYQRLIVVIGTNATAAIWVVLFLSIASVISYGTWKYALIEKVNEEA